MDSDAALFNVLRPICVHLTKSFGYEDVRTLNRALQLTDATIPWPLQEYVLYPLRKFPFKESPLNVVHEVVDCVSSTLKKSTSIRSTDVFQDLFLRITFRMTNPADMTIVADAGEELKTAYLRCLTLLVAKAETSILKQFYTEHWVLFFAHTITVLLNTIQSDAARHVRVDAMKLLAELSLCDKNSDLPKQAAAIFATFIPKSSVVLAKVALGDVVQGHVVTLTALETWLRLVVLVMKDDHLDGSNDSTRVELDRPSKLVEKNETWVKETSANLCAIAERLTELVSHAHWKVRLAVAEGAGRLLLECSNSMSQSRPKLLEAVLTLTADDMGAVSERSSELLRDVARTFTTSSSFVETVEDNLHELVTKLPRILRNADDAKKLSQLHLLAGYLTLLGPKIQNLLHSRSHMDRLAQALLQLSETDCSSIHIVDLKTTSTNSRGRFENGKFAAKKTFRHFTDENIASGLVQICRTLGKQGDIEYLVDYFMEIFNSSHVHRKEAAFVLNQMVTGNGNGAANPSSAPSAGLTDLTVDDDDVRENAKKLPMLINSLLDAFLEPSVWLLPVCLEADDKRDEETASSDVPSVGIRRPEVQAASSVEKLNDNIMLICILLEGLDNYSDVLGVDFVPLFRKVLYPLLDKMGSYSAMVSQTANSVAVRISTNTGYKSVAEMIHANADYLIDQLSTKLRFVLRHHEAPRILCVTVQNSEPEILPLLKDCVDELILGLDTHHAKKTELFMEAIYVLIVQVEKWFSAVDAQRDRLPRPKPSEFPKGGDGEENISFEGIRDYFLTYHKLKEAAKGNVRDLDLDVEDVNVAEEAEAEDNADDVEETKKESPYHVQLVKTALERCVHLVSNKNLSTSVLVLDSINVGLSVLRHWEDDLLPTVHKLWQPLVARFADKNFIVVKKIFLIMCTMADVCQQFVQRKVLKDVWRKIVLFLKEQAKISHGKNTRAYCFTAAYKLQHALLANLAAMVKKLNLSVEHHDELIRSCLPYLSSHQPQELQNAALETFTVVHSFEPDLIWFHVQLRRKEADFERPHACFKAVQVTRAYDEEYEDGISRLISLLELPTNSEQ